MRRASAWLSGRKCFAVLPEFSTWSTGHEIPDVIGWRVGHGSARSVLVEVKTTRSDFLADAKKGVRVHPARGMGHTRWYFTPPGLIGVQELPRSWGLAECSGRTVRVVAPAFPFEEYAGHHEISLLVQAMRRERSSAPGWSSKVYVEDEVPEGVAGALEVG